MISSRKVLRQARQTLAEGRKLFKRATKSLPSDKRQSIRAAIDDLAQSVKDASPECEQRESALRTIINNDLAFARKSNAREIIESLVIALLCALLLRTFLIEPFKIPTRSMVPTLLEGDQLFVTKQSYGLRLPFIDKYVFRYAEPQRGDVVVFAFPSKDAADYLTRTNSGCMSLESIAEEKDYIKRIIGIPGDTIEVIDQVVHVNGIAIQQIPFYTRVVSDYLFLSDQRREFWNIEHLDGHTYTTITHEIPPRRFGPITVQPGHVFAMGDNRDNSADSRCWGQVPIDNIKGRAQIIWWSSGHFAPRWNRMFTWIH